MNVLAWLPLSATALALGTSPGPLQTPVVAISALNAAGPALDGDGIACSPCIEVILKCLDAEAGELLPYMGRVRNCGNVDLLNVVVKHDNGTPLDTSDDVIVLTLPILAPDAKQGFFGTYDPSVPGGTPSTLVATGVGSPPPSCGLGDVTASAQATCLSSCDPCINLILKCNDAGDDGLLPFLGRVENCGDVNLENVTVVHDNGTPLDLTDDVTVLSIPLLAPDEKQGFSGSYLPSVGPGELSTVVGTASASAPAKCGLVDVSDTAEAICATDCDPCINVILKCNDVDAGSEIPYLGRVQNCGNVDLMNVMVAHDNGTPGFLGDDVLILSIPLLPPGDSHTFHGSYPPSVPVGNPSTLVATAIGTPPKNCGSKDVTSDASATCFQTTTVQGCSPGFWKNHKELWDKADDPIAGAAGFVSKTSFNAFFGLTPAESGFADSMTMLDAVHLGGGGPSKLARHGVPGLLNLAAGLPYLLPPGVADASGLTQAIHQAYLSGGFEPLATMIADANEGDCPL